MNKKRITVGLLIDWIVGWEDIPYYETTILEAVHTFAVNHDLNLLTFIIGKLETKDDWINSRNVLLEFLDKQNVDGVISLASSIGITDANACNRRITQLLANVPMVTLSTQYKGKPYIAINNYSGMRQLIDHLIEKHLCSQIVFIRGPEGNAEAEERYKAYQDSLRDHGIKFNHKRVVQGDFLFRAGQDAVKTILDERKVRYDSFAAANDNMAIGAINELYNRGLFTPGNPPVVGFDDMPLSKYFDLTTVRQSFYDQAISAAALLLDKIHRRKCPAKVELQTEMVKRTSCGCISDKILSVCTETKISAFSGSKRDSQEIEKFKAGLIKKISAIRSFENPDFNQRLIHQQTQLIDSFFGELTGRNSEFIKEWNNIVFLVIKEQIDIGLLQDMIFLIRREFLQFNHEPGLSDQSETLFHQAQILINDAILRNENNRKISGFYLDEQLDRIGEELISNLNFEKQMEIICGGLPDLDINSCYVTLYDNPDLPMKTSRLALAYRCDEIQESGRGQEFPTVQMLPEEVKSKLRQNRYSMIVQALIQGNNQIGVVMLDYGNKMGRVYEILRYRMSAALKATLLLDKVKSQTQELEKLVDERTADLVKTNLQLELEIKEKNKAEGQLKKAYAELEIYSRKMHHQTLEDELTGLYNRRGFMTLGNQHFKYAKRMKKGFFILFADLDGLKKINDHFGHSEGDFALIKTAEIFKKSFRNMDIMARIGGDEFIILTVDSSPTDERELIERVNLNFDLFNRKKEKPYLISVSIGAVYFDPKIHHSFEDLIIKADKILYNNKLNNKKLNHE